MYKILNLREELLQKNEGNIEDILLLSKNILSITFDSPIAYAKHSAMAGNPTANIVSSIVSRVTPYNELNLDEAIACEERIQKFLGSESWKNLTQMQRCIFLYHLLSVYEGLPCHIEKGLFNADSFDALPDLTNNIEISQEKLKMYLQVEEKTLFLFGKKSNPSLVFHALRRFFFQMNDEDAKMYLRSVLVSPSGCDGLRLSSSYIQKMEKWNKHYFRRKDWDQVFEQLEQIPISFAAFLLQNDPLTHPSSKWSREFFDTLWKEIKKVKNRAENQRFYHLLSKIFSLFPETRWGNIFGIKEV